MPFCHKCGKEIPEDAEFCSYCGTKRDLPNERLVRNRPQKVTTLSSEVAKIAGIAITVVIVLIVVFALAPKLITTVEQIVQKINPPLVIITSENARTGTVGLDYVIWIDVSVYNEGGSGTVVVWAEAGQGSSDWKKSKTIYLSSDSLRDLTFEFREIGFLTLENSYWRVWVTTP